MDETSLKVVFTSPGGNGYQASLYMARLAAGLLGGELVVLPPGRPALLNKLAGILPFWKRKGAACLLICPSPSDLNSLLMLENLREGHGRLVAWVFDSFWLDRIPRWAKSSHRFDHVFVTEPDDLNVWRSSVHAPVDWLPWGADVLNLGSPSPVRRFDLLRFGRQPAGWDDDRLSSELCTARGLSFQGRPPELPEAGDTVRSLMGYLGDARFTLAFSNRVSPSVQTHPTREYITGRWTDSLAAGAIVAGIPPRSESVQSLLWPEALLDIGTVHPEEGLEVIASAVRAWTPARAWLNYSKSLEALDWRWRFKTLAEALGVHSSQLETELASIRKIIGSGAPPPLSDDLSQPEAR